MYNGALADMALDTDPFTGNRYTFASGNPISNVELTGHMAFGSIYIWEIKSQGAATAGLKDLYFYAWALQYGTVPPEYQGKTVELGFPVNWPPGGVTVNSRNGKQYNAQNYSGPRDCPTGDCGVIVYSPVQPRKPQQQPATQPATNPYPCAVTSGRVVPGRHRNGHRAAHSGIQLLAYTDTCGPGGYPIPAPWPAPLPAPGVPAGAGPAQLRLPWQCAHCRGPSRDSLGYGSDVRHRGPRPGTAGRQRGECA